jgi:phage terminase large subunit-like protein
MLDWEFAGDSCSCGIVVEAPDRQTKGDVSVDCSKDSAMAVS